MVVVVVAIDEVTINDDDESGSRNGTLKSFIPSSYSKVDATVVVVVVEVEQEQLLGDDGDAGGGDDGDGDP